MPEELEDTTEGIPAGTVDTQLATAAPEDTQQVDTTTAASDGTQEASDQGLADRAKPDEGPAADMDDFLAAKQGVNKEEVRSDAKPKTNETKVDDKTPKTDDKPVTAKPEDGKPVAEATQQTTQGKVKRDYTGFDADESKLLERMSNDAFNRFRPQLLEHKNLSKVLKDKDATIASLKSGKQLLPESYYEHPQAFVLTPDFAKASQDYNTAAQIQSHWQTQFSNIRKGEKWQDADLDSKGNLVLSKPQEPTPEAEAAVTTYLHHASNLVMKQKESIDRLAGSFQQRHQEAVNVLREAEKMHYSAYEDPNHPMQPVIKNLTANVPSEFRNSPMTPLLVKSAAAVIQLGNELKAARAELAKVKGTTNGKGTQQVSTARRAAGPNESDTTAGGSKGSEPVVTIDDFNAIKNS